MDLKNKIAVITGANGFIGKNLAGILNEKGARVALVPRELLTSPSLLEDYMNTIQPDYIFHLAAHGNHYSQKNDIDETFMTNVIKTYNVLRASVNIDYTAFVNVSTSSVYGEKEKAMKEDMLCNPDTLYSCTKYSGEQLALMYNKVLGKPVVNVRPFSVYGPGEADGRFIPNVIRSMITGQTLDLVEEPVHDWIYVEDFIDGVLAIVDNVDKFAGQVVNIGTGKQFTNAEVVDELLANDEKATFPINKIGSMRSYDKSVWKADISKIKEVWKPKFTLKQGLKATYAYYKELYKNEEKEFDPVKKSLENFGIEFKRPEDLINGKK